MVTVPYGRKKSILSNILCVTVLAGALYQTQNRHTGMDLGITRVVVSPENDFWPDSVKFRCNSIRVWQA